MTHSQHDIVQALRDAGCRITRQRRAIIGYLAGRPDHPSARQIHAHLEGREPSLSLATVYNTVASLVDLGLLREVEFESVDNRYDTNLAPHINLVCTSCGAIADVDHAPPVAIGEIRDHTGFQTNEVRMEYRGICERCRTPDAGAGRRYRGGRR